MRVRIRGAFLLSCGLLACGEAGGLDASLSAEREGVGVGSAQLQGYGGKGGGGCFDPEILLEVEALAETHHVANPQPPQPTYDVVNDPSFSGNAAGVLYANSPGDWVQYAIPPDPDLTCFGQFTPYRIGVRKTPSSGKMRLLSNAHGGLHQVGQVQDLYAPTVTYTELSLNGLRPGTILRFQVLTRNPLSSGHQLDLDYIHLAQ